MLSDNASDVQSRYQTLIGQHPALPPYAIAKYKFRLAGENHVISIANSSCLYCGRGARRNVEEFLLPVDFIGLHLSLIKELIVLLLPC